MKRKEDPRSGAKRTVAYVERAPEGLTQRFAEYGGPVGNRRNKKGAHGVTGHGPGGEDESLQSLRGEARRDGVTGRSVASPFGSGSESRFRFVAVSLVRVVPPLRRISASHRVLLGVCRVARAARRGSSAGEVSRLGRTGVHPHRCLREGNCRFGKVQVAPYNLYRARERGAVARVRPTSRMPPMAVLVFG